MVLFKDKDKIRIRVFMEVLGWPADKLVEHLKTVLGALNDKLKWKISREVYAEPVKAGEKMFSTHVEFEAELDDVHQLFMFAMTNGPSVIEVLEPSEFYIPASQMQDILSDLVSKAQSMDKEIKVLASQNTQFTDLLQNLEKAGILKKKPLNDETSPE